MITKSGRKWGRRGLCLVAALCLMWAAAADEPAPQENHAGQIMDELTTESKNAMMEAPKEEPAEETTEEPAEEPEEEPAEKPEEEPEEDPTEGPEEEPEDDPTEEPEEEPKEDPAEEAKEEPKEDLEEEPAEDTAEEPTEKSGEASTEGKKAGDEMPGGAPMKDAEGGADGTTDEPSGDSTEGPAETSTQTQEVTPPPEEEIDEDPEHFEYADDTRETVTGYTGGKRRIRIPNGVRYIEKEAFKGNELLEEVYLPDTLEEIRDEAFAECTNLTAVIFNMEYPPTYIGHEAFHGCDQLIRDIKDMVETVEDDAFDEPTPPPVTDPPITPTPKPEDEDEDWDEDWDEDIEWETTTITSTGGKKSTQVSAPKHARSGPKMLHDYDQVLVKGGETAPMQELTLGGEKLALSLKGENDEPAKFTAAFAAGNALWDGKAESVDNVDTLMLRASAESGNRWSLDGTLLRQLHKTGIDYIMFRDGTGDVIVPTEGFLAGWEYEEMRRKGVAGRKFEYTLTTGEHPEWVVTVEGKAYEISEDSLSPIYMTGVTTIPKGSERDLRAEMENGL